MCAAHRENSYHRRARVLHIVTYCTCPQDDGGHGTSKPDDRTDDKRIFFDDIFGSVSFDAEEKLPVSNCTCSEYIILRERNVRRKKKCIGTLGIN